jgi:hypothetical protein
MRYAHGEEFKMRGFSCKGVLAGVVMLGLLGGWHGPAVAGSDHSTDAYGGDVTLFALPPGTLVVTEYLGYRQSEEYDTTANNIYAKLTGGKTSIRSAAQVNTAITRLTYLTKLWGQPLAFSAEGVFVNPDKFNIGNLPAPVGGLGPQTIGSAFIDPSIFVSYGVIVNPKNERFLALSNYVYFPAGDYDKFKQINFSTPGQYTWVPQLSYSEGLAKFGLRNVWFDFIANLSVHTDGDVPLALAPNVQFNKLTQDNSYDIKAFLRYSFNPLAFISLGAATKWLPAECFRPFLGDQPRLARMNSPKVTSNSDCRSISNSRLPVTLRTILKERVASRRTSRRKYACRISSLLAPNNPHR